MIDIDRAPNGDRHCDEYIDDPTTPEPLRRYLSWATLPACCQYPPPEDKWVPKEMRPYIWREPEPRLFADWNGERVQVTVASRFGDVGISRDLTDRARSYFARVSVASLSNFSDAPPDAEQRDG